MHFNNKLYFGYENKNKFRIILKNKYLLLPKLYKRNTKNIITIKQPLGTTLNLILIFKKY